MAAGRLFQTRGPATANAMSPSDVIVRGISSITLAADREPGRPRPAGQKSSARLQVLLTFPHRDDPVLKSTGSRITGTAHWRRADKQWASWHFMPDVLPATTHRLTREWDRQQSILVVYPGGLVVSPNNNTSTKYYNCIYVMFSDCVYEHILHAHCRTKRYLKGLWNDCWCDTFCQHCPS